MCRGDRTGEFPQVVPLSVDRQPSTTTLRRLLNSVVVAVGLLVVLPLVAVLERARRGRGLRFGRRAVVVVAGACGVRFEVLGLERLEPGGSYVFVPNHNSPLDIPAMVVARPEVQFVAAAELFSHPVLRLAMDALGTVRLDRDDTRLAARQLAAAAGGDQLRLVIFADGGLVAPDHQHPFKTGAFVLAIDAQASVVPVAIHGASHIVPKGELYGIRRGRVVIEFLEPIPTKDLTRADRKRLRTDAQVAVRGALARGV